MYSTSSTPKRALLACQWQQTRYSERAPVAELLPGLYERVHTADLHYIFDGPNPKWTDKVPPFQHEQIDQDSEDTCTYIGNLACHVMWPFEYRSASRSATIIVGVDSPKKDFSLVKVEPSRLQVAVMDVEFMSTADPTFIEMLARGASELPRSDVFTDNSG